jgi:uncharacterized SAM-dependent methyltransferase
MIDPFRSQVVLYDGPGINLFQDITRDQKYYIYREELAILEKYGCEIVWALSPKLLSYTD